MREIRERRSIRKYKDTPVERKKVEEALRSASLAPSGNNRQPWQFIVVSDPERRQALTEACNSQSWMMGAPVFIACIADIRARAEVPKDLRVDEDSPHWELKRVIRDTGVAIGYLMLEATHLGLGTCWIGMYSQKDIRPILGIPEDMFVLGIVTLGYADENPSSRPRKDLSQIVHWERWGGKA
ncbi:MAG: nitroreductase [Spirochaetes bacterium]|nr:MAG: nitroreductase [Spirochaetota bacterium]